MKSLCSGGEVEKKISKPSSEKRGGQNLVLKWNVQTRI